MSTIAISEFVVMTTTREATFAAFYEQNVDVLARTLTASLVDAQVAQDAAQEAMARACERWDKIEHYDNPVGWCYRCLLYTSPSPRDATLSRMPSSA